MNTEAANKILPFKEQNWKTCCIWQTCESTHPLNFLTVPNQVNHHNCRMPFKAFNEKYRERFDRQCKVAHYGFDNLVDLFEAMPSTVRVPFVDGELVIQLTDSARAQWNNDEDEAPVNVGVVDVDDEDEDITTAPPTPIYKLAPKPAEQENDGEEAVSKNDDVEDITTAPSAHVDKKSANDKPRMLAPKVAGQEHDRFAAFNSLDFGRLLSCR